MCVNILFENGINIGEFLSVSGYIVWENRLPCYGVSCFGYSAYTQYSLSAPPSYEGDGYHNSKINQNIDDKTRKLVSGQWEGSYNH